jgi:hypothetical protein
MLSIGSESQLAALKPTSFSKFSDHTLMDLSIRAAFFCRKARAIAWQS